MFDWVVDTHNLDYDERQRKLVHTLVTASEDKDLARHCARERPWLYEVVSNPRNSVDVDKVRAVVRMLPLAPAPMLPLAPAPSPNCASR